MRVGERCQTPLDDILFALAFSYSSWVSFAAQWQVTNGGENAVVLCERLRSLTQESGKFITPLFQGEGIALGRNRPTMVKVVYSKGPRAVVELDLLGLQSLTIGFPQARKQQAFMHLHRGAVIPGDIKEAGVGRGRAVFEHITPPLIGVPHYTHMVGHNIKDLAHPVALESQA